MSDSETDPIRLSVINRAEERTVAMKKQQVVAHNSTLVIRVSMERRVVITTELEDE